MEQNKCITTGVEPTQYAQYAKYSSSGCMGQKVPTHPMKVSRNHQQYHVAPFMACFYRLIKPLLYFPPPSFPDSVFFFTDLTLLLQFFYYFYTFVDVCFLHVMTAHHQWLHCFLRATNSSLVTCVQHNRSAMACNVHILISQFSTLPNQQNEHNYFLFTGEMHYPM